MEKERRRELHQILVDILGSSNVYFQPPESVKLNYPCIVYSRDNIRITYADNRNYREKTRYQITYISKDPDDTAVTRKLREMKYCTFNRHYPADNLYHDVYLIYS